MYVTVLSVAIPIRCKEKSASISCSGKGICTPSTNDTLAAVTSIVVSPLDVDVDVDVYVVLLNVDVLVDVDVFDEEVLSSPEIGV